jgi:hypothetical protein
MACAQTADQNVVCTTSDIPMFSLRQVLTLSPLSLSLSLPRPARASGWRVPVYQRRYCWREAQLQRLLADVLGLCPTPHAPAGPGRSHELGRLMVATNAAGDELILIDGQQRLTTVCILISAIRDFLGSFISDSAAGVSTGLEPLWEVCNGILLPDGKPVLQPTYFDRQSFAACIAATRDEAAFRADMNMACGGGGSGGADDYVLHCRHFFDNALRSGIIASKLGFSDPLSSAPLTKPSVLLEMCGKLVSTVLDKLTMLFFLVREADLQSVYERLAMREALIAQGTYNKAAGVSMSESDLARNLVTSFGCGEAAQSALYAAHWAPIEDMAAAAAAAAASKTTLSTVLNRFLSAFIARMGKSQVAASAEQPEGGVKTNVTAWFDPGKSHLKHKCCKRLLKYFFPFFLNLFYRFTVFSDVQNSQAVHKYCATK